MARQVFEGAGLLRSNGAEYLSKLCGISEGMAVQSCACFAALAAARLIKRVVDIASRPISSWGDTGESRQCPTKFCVL